MNLFLIYVWTLSIFPGFLYENTGQHGLGTWYALVLVAVYNFWDLVGRYMPLVKWLQTKNRKALTIVVLSRYLLVPAFYFIAKYGDKGWMIMLISILGLSTGHLTVCILTVAPKGYMVINLLFLRVWSFPFYYISISYNYDSLWAQTYYKQSTSSYIFILTYILWRARRRMHWGICWWLLY